MSNFEGEMWTLQRETIKKYEQWYSASLVFVEQFIPEKVRDFTFYYCRTGNTGDQIFDILQFHDTSHNKRIDKNALLRSFIGKFDRQRHILSTIPGILMVKELGLREILYAVFVEREIDEADYLYSREHYRAAGAIAGVALEQHLRFLCDKYDLDYGKKDTIEPLVQKLYANKKIERVELTNIQHLASIRDKCDHPSDITSGEVKELIESVKKIL
jgi:hypothetical protein